jgi:hypothetical protein
LIDEFLAAGLYGDELRQSISALCQPIIDGLATEEILFWFQGLGKKISRGAAAVNRVR